MPPKLTPEVINAAIAGFEQQKHQIDAQIADLRAMLPGNTQNGTTPDAAPRKRRKFSAAAILRMKEAQKRRWAKVRGHSEPSAQATPEPKPKREMSAAGRRAISEATKKRWALKRAEAANTRKRSTPKKSTPAAATTA